ncbi:aldo/keto reductase [Rhizobium sp. PL01]|uniref:aldo/keto reductase n=1 Tax=Rhizobium sp. PL01 TaxID=3085631 RepID=UPI0029819E0E|nr:aldo/keto reductase [Rhizobium sp. PL01]MDW5315850.1 aldo/keto reductase [Rhizobium sp. PL01]
MDLTSYRTLGRSGLAVSPLALGTMTFGAERWGAGTKSARALFDTYIDAGGNFFDTADVYSAGRSEEMLGTFVADTGLRDRVVIATKSGFSRSQGTPLHGGNGSKNIRLGIEGSLKRLQTDYLDMYWMHVWDRTTPAEEVLQTLSDAVRSGKILHYGFSNTPSWYAAKIATLAAAHGLPVPIGMQYAYSLVDRGIELDILPAAVEFGMGLVPWSPLAAGLLTGKYGRDMLAHAGERGGMPNQASGDEAQESNGRLNGDNPFGGMLFTEHNFDVVDVVRQVAIELDRPMAAVALAWTIQRPGIDTILIGASRAEQLLQNVEALDVALTSDQLARLDRISAPPSFNPYFIFDLPTQVMFGGQTVRPWIKSV